MNRLLATWLLCLLPMPMVGCAQPGWFDPADQTQVDQLVMRSIPLATAAADAAVLSLDASDLIATRAVLVEVKQYVALMPAAATIADVGPIIDLAVNRLVADPARRGQVLAVARIALTVAAGLVPEPPPDSTLAEAAVYSAVARRVLLTALTAVLDRLPQPAIVEAI